MIAYWTHYLSFVSGAVLAGGVVYYFEHKLFQERLDEEMLKCKEYYEAKGQSDIVVHQESVEEVVEEVEVDDEEVEVRHKYETLTKNYEGEDPANVVNYHRIYDDELAVEKSEETHEEEEVFDEPHVEEVLAEIEKSSEDSRIIILSLDQYWNDDSSYEEVDLLYDSHNKVLLHDDRSEVKNPETWIGTQALELLREGTLTHDSMYILNRSRERIYEVFYLD